MKRKLLYFINPISGGSTKKKNTLRRIITEKTNEKNFHFEIADTLESGDYSFLPQKIKEEQITDIIICGGDGTINKIAAALINTKVALGIIPGGSGNGLAFSVKIPSDTKLALDLIFTGKHHSIDAFYINDNFSCMLCGIGMDAQIAHDFAKQSTRGLSTYVKETLKNFITSSSYNFTISINDQKINTDAFFISIANSNQFGNNVTIAPKASLSDGFIDIVIVKKMNKAKLLWAVAKQLKFGKLDDQNHETSKDILYFQTKSLSIINHHSAPLHIDGDPAETAKKFNVTILPKSLRLIHP